MQDNVLDSASLWDHAHAHIHTCCVHKRLDLLWFNPGQGLKGIWGLMGSQCHTSAQRRVEQQKMTCCESFMLTSDVVRPLTQIYLWTKPPSWNIWALRTTYQLLEASMPGSIHGKKKGKSGRAIAVNACCLPPPYPLEALNPSRSAHPSGLLFVTKVAGSSGKPLAVTVFSDTQQTWVFLAEGPPEAILQQWNCYLLSLKLTQPYWSVNNCAKSDLISVEISICRERGVQVQIPQDTKGPL